MLPIINVLANQFKTLSDFNAAPAAPSLASPGAAAQPAPFSDLFSDAVGAVNQLETQANSAVTGLIGGKGVDVHQAMIATQKASIAFELTLAVRNKAVQAYQSVIGMQFLPRLAERGRGNIQLKRPEFAGQASPGRSRTG
jgi:flagellar hook-basal body complex protein FliE